jgi:hypothetical protein
MNLLRAVSSEGFGRLKYHTEVRRRLDVDREFRPYFEQETARLPRFYTDLVRRDLGPLWRWLPEGALDHDPNADLAAEGGRPGDARGPAQLRRTDAQGRQDQQVGLPEVHLVVEDPPGP